MEDLVSQPGDLDQTRFAPITLSTQEIIRVLGNCKGFKESESGTGERTYISSSFYK